MRTGRKKAALPASIIVTVLAYGILGFVLFRERPATIYSEGVARFVDLLPHAIAVVNTLALVPDCLEAKQVANLVMRDNTCLSPTYWAFFICRNLRSKTPGIEYSLTI
jgi:hypothetical protein